MKKINVRQIFDIVAWIVIGLILLWLILKVTGVINTPLWLQYSPLFGAVYLAGWFAKKITGVADDVKDIKKEVKEIDKDMAIIKRECPKFNN